MPFLMDMPIIQQRCDFLKQQTQSDVLHKVDKTTKLANMSYLFPIDHKELHS